MLGGGDSTKPTYSESEPFDFLIAVVILFVGWMGILFVHTGMPYANSRRSATDLFDSNEDDRPSTHDRPFWFITFSSMIVFSIIFILINNISYDKNDLSVKNSGQGKTALEDLLFAFSLFKNRFQVFFSEIFFMMTFIIFLWLNYRFYDAFKYQASVPIIRNTIYFFIAFTGLNVLIFCASYFIPYVSDRGSNPAGGIRSLQLLFDKVKTQGLRLQQLKDSRVKSNLKYFSTVLFIGSMTCLIILYIYVNFYLTDEKPI